MSQSFAKIAFTPLVKQQQTLHGSRRQYERVEQPDSAGDALTEAERYFIAASDSFFMASVSETGWPYIQHRGGERGFLRVLDEHRLAFPDYRGNKQYISIGNLLHDDRVALFLIDYPSQTRLKILGRATIHEGDGARDLIDRIVTPGERNVVERAIVIRVEAFDWNCPQHITPRYTEEQIVRVLAPLKQRITELEQDNKRLRSALKKAAEDA